MCALTSSKTGILYVHADKHLNNALNISNIIIIFNNKTILNIFSMCFVNGSPCATQLSCICRLNDSPLANPYANTASNTFEGMLCGFGIIVHRLTIVILCGFYNACMKLNLLLLGYLVWATPTDTKQCMKIAEAVLI